mmetsp:Transcript_27227/g.61103  ORF Transcript_27227/g.61103 Transcript_27227/m.61103 type:complete len:159 (-) Transcript_27227:2-478(-)
MRTLPGTPVLPPRLLCLPRRLVGIMRTPTVSAHIVAENTHGGNASIYCPWASSTNQMRPSLYWSLCVRSERRRSRGTTRRSRRRKPESAVAGVSHPAPQSTEERADAPAEPVCPAVASAVALIEREYMSDEDLSLFEWDLGETDSTSSSHNSKSEADP